MIKKRNRPHQRVREPTPDDVDDDDNDELAGSDDERLPLAELIEIRKLRKARQGIDAAKLNKGDAKKKRKRPVEEAEVGGLQKVAVEEEDEDEEREARARRAVRSSNFTQQTNVLDVDKHMMAYIEENLQVRSHPRPPEPVKPLDPHEALYQLASQFKVSQQKPTPDEGNVTNSISMLTAIPEVDLGMDARLKNIEDTEKAKRLATEAKQDRKHANNDEAHLVANRFYRPNIKTKSDSDILRDAKLEAMGVSPTGGAQRHTERPQMATDELVMERFKKRMRK